MPSQTESGSAKPKKKRGRKPHETSSTIEDLFGDVLYVPYQTKPKKKPGRKPKEKGSTAKNSSAKKRKPSTKAKSTKSKRKYQSQYSSKNVYQGSWISIITLQKILEKRLAKIANRYRILAGLNSRAQWSRNFFRRINILPSTTTLPFIPASPVRPEFHKYVDKLDSLKDFLQPVPQPLYPALMKRIQDHRIKYAYKVLIEERVQNIYHEPIKKKPKPKRRTRRRRRKPRAKRKY